MKLQKGLLLGLFSVLVISGLTVGAQEPTVVAVAGTRLRVQFDTPVGTASSRVNEGVEVHLLQPVESAGRVVLPAGTILSGRVLAVHKGDKHSRTFPMLRLGITHALLPDGRSVPASASLADLGITMYVDSEGVATPEKPTKGGDVAVPVVTGAAGAGVGAAAGGGKGAAEGAAIGAAIGILGDLAAHSAQWGDFTLKKGRKAWLRLDADLEVPLALNPSGSH